jgi:hypothetical protein
VFRTNRRRLSSAPQSGDAGTPGSLPRTFVERYNQTGNLAPGTRYYDRRSYYADTTNLPVKYEADHWISERNWSRLIDYPGFDRCWSASAR